MYRQPVSMLFDSLCNPNPSGAEPPLLGWSWSRRPHLLGKQKGKPYSCVKHNLRSIYSCINNELFKSWKWQILVYGAGAAWSRLFYLEPELTQFGRNRSRLRDLRLPEPEPPKKCPRCLPFCETLFMSRVFDSLCNPNPCPGCLTRCVTLFMSRVFDSLCNPIHVQGVWLAVPGGV